MADAAPEWEVSKENFQPLKAGRSARGLGTPKKEVPRAVLIETEERRKQFEQELQSYAGDDPLEVWTRYIRWVQEAYRAGGAKAQLVPLLERCTRELEAQPRYRGDHRYLRVWIQYADQLPEPQDVFTYLRDKGIGQEQALYYTAYATFLEMRGAHTRAREAFREGLAKYAAPLDQLRRKYDEFEHRMVKREERKARGEAASDAADAAVSRTTFGELPTRARALARAGPATRPPRAGLSAARRAPAADAENAAPSDAAGGDLAVFVDPEFGGADEGPEYHAPRSTMERLASFDAGRKENTMAPAPWAGQQLPQRRSRGPAGSVPPAPTLDIPQDEELADAPPLPLDAQQKPLRRHLEGDADLQHVLEHDPLRLHMAPPPHPAQEASAHAVQPAAAQQQPAAAQQRRQRGARETVLAYDAAALNQPGGGGGDADGEEMSFEELRAAHRNRMRAAAAGSAVDSTAAGTAAASDMAVDGEVKTEAAAADAAAADGTGGAAAAAAAANLAEPQARQQATVPQMAASPAGQPASAQQSEGMSGGTAEAFTAMDADVAPAGEAPAAAASEATTSGAMQPLPAATAASPAPQPAYTSAAAAAVAAVGTAAGLHAHEAETHTPAAAAGSPAAPSPGKRKRGHGLATHLAVLRPRTPVAQPAAMATASTSPAAAVASSHSATSLAAPAALGEVATSPAAEDRGDADLDDAFLGAFSGPVLEAASASVSEPTLTANTREAWAAINGMFSSALPHESAAVSVDVGGGPAAAAARPPLPRRASLGAGGRRSSASGAAGNPFSAAAAARARRTRRSSILPSAFTQPIVIREDTEYLSFGDGASPSSRPADSVTCHGSLGGGGSGAAAAAGAAAEDTGPLSMYEDTGLLTGPLDGKSGPTANAAAGAIADTAASRAGGSFGSDDIGLLIREDTCCLSDAPVAAASTALEQTGGLQLYEDTGFLTENMAPRTAAAAAAATSQALPAAAATIGAGAAAAAAAGTTDGLQLYEDTGFSTENMAPRTAAAAGAAATSQALPAAAAAAAAATIGGGAAATAAEATGGLQLYEDTGFLTENVAPQPAATSPAAFASAPADEEEFDGEAENEPPANAALRPSIVALRLGTGHKLPLQALSDAQATARGIEIGDGLPSDAEEDAVPPAVALAQAGSELQDNFVVYRNM